MVNYIKINKLSLCIDEVSFEVAVKIIANQNTKPVCKDFLLFSKSELKKIIIFIFEFFSF